MQGDLCDMSSSKEGFLGPNPTIGLYSSDKEGSERGKSKLKDMNNYPLDTYSLRHCSLL